MKARFTARPSTALVVAIVALFAALSGTAGAVVTAAVPLAKRAFVADNAKKLNGVTANQLGSAAVAVALRESPPGPRAASSVAGLMTVKTSSTSLAPNGEGASVISCDDGRKVAGGGFSSDGAVVSFDSFPSSDSAWTLYLVNASESAGANVTLYATCIK